MITSLIFQVVKVVITVGKLGTFLENVPTKQSMEGIKSGEVSSLDFYSTCITRNQVFLSLIIQSMVIVTIIPIKFPFIFFNSFAMDNMT